MTEPNDDFSMRVEYGTDPTTATVAVSGDVDLLTGPALGGVMNALIASGRQRIVVDLAGAEYVDGRGATVFAEAIAHGAQVTIRSASAITRRMLTVTGVSGLVVENAPHERFASMPAGRPRSSTDVVDAALRLVTALADATVTNADGVSVTLERHGRLMTVAASNDEVLTMDRHQYETGEGPCLDAKALDRWFYIESLADETRWPAFVPLALEQGIHSILSSPLKTVDRAQGALNIYSSTERAFGEREQELARLFADQASRILTAAGQEDTETEANGRFAAALATRQVIHQAQGIIMARNGVTANEAIRALFRSARDANVTVVAHATTMIDSVHTETGSE